MTRLISLLVLISTLLTACATPTLAPTTRPGSIDIQDVGTITPTPPFGTETATPTPRSHGNQRDYSHRAA